MICKKLAKCIEGEFNRDSLDTCDNLNRSACIQSSDTRPKVQCEEKKKSYRLNNTKGNHVVNCKMDGGVIVTDRTVPEKTNKCDYMFVVKEQGKVAVLIELKGQDFSKAIKQINNTLVLYRDFFKTCSKVYGRIVGTSSVPKLKATPHYVNLAAMLRREYGGNLKTGERQMEENDTDLDVVR